MRVCPCVEVCRGEGVTMCRGIGKFITCVTLHCAKGSHTPNILHPHRRLLLAVEHTFELCDHGGTCHVISF